MPNDTLLVTLSAIDLGHTKMSDKELVDEIHSSLSGSDMLGGISLCFELATDPDVDDIEVGHRNRIEVGEMIGRGELTDVAAPVGEKFEIPDIQLRGIVGHGWKARVEALLQDEHASRVIVMRDPRDLRSVQSDR